MFEISAQQVSPGHLPAGVALQKWRERPVAEIRYLFLLARYKKVRENNQVRDAAVLAVTGIDPLGKLQ